MEVRLDNISKVFVGRKGERTTAVSQMTLTIPDGKLVGLLGPSGCGKSTTLYMIAGLHRPTEGKIYFGENDVTNIPPEKRGIGLVFQNYALYPHMSVRENIMFPLENVRPRIPKLKMMEIAQRMANLVDIGRFMDRKPKELSGGQQQRVAIARALAKTPSVLLLDEPLSNLDARLRLQTREEIKRIQKETGITTIFVTHDQEEAMSISDEIVVMKNSLVQQIGEPQYVYDEPVNMFVAKFLGSPAINIFKGELRDDKLYINGVVFDNKGYEAKGDFDYGSEDAYRAFAGAGFQGTYENYLQLVYHYDELVESHREYEQAVAAAHDKKEPTDHIKMSPVSAVKGEVIIKDHFDELVTRLAGFGKKLNIDVEKCRREIVEIKIQSKFNRTVNIGVRPECFTLEEKGKIIVDVAYIEHIGRDISVIGHVENQESKVRIIIPASLRSQANVDVLHFSARKFYVFEDNEDGTRIK